ncbi:MAG: YqaJ viral recombinase family protein [Aeromicrobium erythreum]
MTLTVHQEVLQGSDEWHELRRGVLTASTIGALITTKTKKVASNDTARGLIAALVAERLTEWEDPEFTNRDMERGHQVEPIARDWYSKHTGQTVEQVGFMVHEFDDGTRLGFSPDGLVGDDGLLEVKAPRAKRHIQWHVEDKVPDAHMAQCQAGMFVAGRSWLDFVSYVGGEPPFLKRVHADPDWFAAIENAARHFEVKAAEMAQAYKNATAGIPSTPVLPDPYEVELRLA